MAFTLRFFFMFSWSKIKVFVYLITEKKESDTYMFCIGSDHPD